MFNYEQAFSRNIGWLTIQEQQKLRRCRVAIAGAGGVGGIHLLTLSRLGIGNFNIADFDTFEIHNFNRQSGAMMSTIDQEKVKVMQSMALDINPELDIKVYGQGINETNVDDFLAGVDIYVDSLDFFALNARKMVFKRCYEMSIPVVTAAPLGMGCAYLAFLPGQMSYEQYFRFEGKSELDQYIQFLIGLSPGMLQQGYLVEQSALDFDAKKGPSTPMAVNLCAGIAGTNVVKILLQRGDVLCAPRGLHFDAFRNKMVKTHCRFGNNGLQQRMLFRLAKRMVTKG